MPNPATAVIQDHIDAAEASLESLEIDLMAVTDEPTRATLTGLQSAYRNFIAEARRLAE